jgi:hypothetical protein
MLVIVRACLSLPGDKKKTKFASRQNPPLAAGRARSLFGHLGRSLMI